MATYKCFMQTEFGAFGLATKILQAENRQNVDEFEPTYFVITDIDEKRFVIFEHTINHLSLVKFIYHNLNTGTIFLVF